MSDRERIAAILRMHFSTEDPGAMVAIAIRDNEPLTDDDWLLVADEILTQAGLRALEQERPRLAAMRTWPRGSNGSVAVAAYEGLVWRLWGIVTKGEPEPEDERVTQ